MKSAARSGIRRREARGLAKRRSFFLEEDLDWCITNGETTPLTGVLVMAVEHVRRRRWFCKEEERAVLMAFSRIPSFNFQYHFVFFVPFLNIVPLFTATPLGVAIFASMAELNLNRFRLLRKLEGERNGVRKWKSVF